MDIVNVHCAKPIDGVAAAVARQANHAEVGGDWIIADGPGRSIAPWKIP